MKSNLIPVMKKELARFLGDKRILISTVLLPGLLIYIMYSFMGSAIGKKFETQEGFVPAAQIVNLPESIEAFISHSGFEYTVVESDQIQGIKETIAEQKSELLIVFPDGFDQAIAEYSPQSGQAAPNVELYYNALHTESSAAFSAYKEVLDAYEATIANKFDLNSGDGVFNLATEKDTSGSIFSSMMPMLLLIFLFSGCMAVAPEAIAGEKERGTIATLLVTPTKRSQLATGKVLALAIIALLSGASSTLGTMLSLPKLMGQQATANVFYTATDYAMLAGVILSTVLVLVSLISLISAFAKTTKEAQTYVMPLMAVVMLIGITGLFGSGAKTELFWYFLPIYNTVQCLVGVFSFSASITHVLVTIGTNCVVAAIGTLLLTKMFNSERIMFNK